METLWPIVTTVLAAVLLMLAGSLKMLLQKHWEDNEALSHFNMHKWKSEARLLLDDRSQILPNAAGEWTVPPNSKVAGIVFPGVLSGYLPAVHVLLLNAQARSPLGTLFYEMTPDFYGNTVLEFSHLVNASEATIRVKILCMYPPTTVELTTKLDGHKGFVYITPRPHEPGLN